MKILYTGFEPFGDDHINAAYEAVKLLPDLICESPVLRLQLPTVFGEAPRILIDAVRIEAPDIVICVGQASGRAEVTPEYVGINCRTARIPDNAGQKPFDEKIMPDGPDAYFTKLPVHDIVQKCREQQIPASVSYSAGTYVCNDVMYSLLHAIRHQDPQILGGFVHVPCLPVQAAGKHPPVPSMDPCLSAKALQLAGQTAVEHLRMLRGQLH